MLVAGVIVHSSEQLASHGSGYSGHSPHSTLVPPHVSRVTWHQCSALHTHLEFPSWFCFLQQSNNSIICSPADLCRPCMAAGRSLCQNTRFLRWLTLCLPVLRVYIMILQTLDIRDTWQWEDSQVSPGVSSRPPCLWLYCFILWDRTPAAVFWAALTCWERSRGGTTGVWQHVTVVSVGTSSDWWLVTTLGREKSGNLCESGPRAVAVWSLSHIYFQN